jgi:branched-chain amino acid transport system ATP-binding protein
MTAAIELAGVHKSFGATEIIRDIDWSLEAGELHAIIGPNGAGKSTLYNLITGRYHVSAGRITLHGREITNRTPFEINRMGLSRSFQVTNIFPRMSVFENIRCGVLWSMGYKYSFWQFVNRQRDLQERTEMVLEQIGMTARRDVPAGLLSYADQRALELGITIGGGAEVILLDEPTSGMSHSETEQAVELIRTIAKDKTLAIVEHDMSVVFGLADRISVLVYGEIIATGTPDEVRGNKDVQVAYLGTEAA